ncbi:alpha/beta fold hydrolase [Roseicyclus amphidinii]|uniref:alpha/beta fold hydrolase n=1 Tax=Roseicyclus amphidinii TaxID=3034232 RepID=UPI0024E0D13B|nr:alpha/beta hydrolase [Roseicyclus sp. Amp-Y-6]
MGKRENRNGSTELAKIIYRAIPDWRRDTQDVSRQSFQVERFFLQTFGQCQFPLALYDAQGGLLFSGSSGGDFPKRLSPQENAPTGCGFTMAGGCLYFTLQTARRWPHAPRDIAFVAVRIASDGFPMSGVIPAAGALTDSELELLCHLIAGSDLKTAAEQTGASYDTKRKQVQKILQKLGHRSQGDMLRLLSVSLTARLVEELVAHLPADAETALAQGHYGPSLVVTRVNSGSGLEVPVWDIGPRDGAPIVYFHSMLAPVIFHDQLPEALHAHDLRFLMVPRHFMDINEVSNSRARQKHIIDAVASALSYLTSRPFICIGDSAGCSWAVQFACNHPDMVSELHLVATPQSSVGVQPPTLFTDVSSRIKASERVVYSLTRIYNLISRSPVFSRRALGYMYRGSPSDLATLDEAFSQYRLSEWLTLIASGARHSSIDEVVSLQGDWVRGLFDTPAPVTFWHGTQDPICPVEDVRALARRLPGARMRVIDSAGHFLSSQQIDALLFALSAARSNRTG